MDFSAVPFKSMSYAESERVSADVITLITGKFSGYSSLQSAVISATKNYEDCPEVTEVIIHSSILTGDAVDKISEVVSKDVIARFNKSFQQFCSTNAVTEEEQKAFPSFVPGVSQQKHAMTARKLNALRNLPFEKNIPPEEESVEVLYSPVRGFAKLNNEYKIPYQYSASDKYVSFLYKGVKVTVKRSSSSPSYGVVYNSFGMFGQYIGKMLNYFGVEMSEVNAYVTLSNNKNMDLSHMGKIVVFREINEICQFLGMDYSLLFSIRTKADAINVLTSAKFFCLDMFKDLPDSNDFNAITYSQIVQSSPTRASGISYIIENLSEEKRFNIVANYCGLRDTMKHYATVVKRNVYVDSIASKERMKELLSSEIPDMDDSIVLEVLKHSVTTLQLMQDSEINQLNTNSIKNMLVQSYTAILGKKNTASTEYLGTI